jgi:hypothetical protein
MALVVPDIDNRNDLMLAFVFADLAIRVPGTYTLDITVVDMRKSHMSYSFHTGPISVFQPKDFPGKIGIM